MAGPLETLEHIHAQLEAPVAAALDWINSNQGRQFTVTGLVGEAQALEAAPGEAFELGIVLCDGEICSREQVVITPEADSYQISLQQPEFEIPPLLDPPEGVRQGWLSEQLEKHDFLLLLFYRGRW